ncbi:MAG TPA: bifunctional metallophosphatase/5'-nucleotidase [Aquabacterium sp.]|uniref:bifunctional metallophosphatase/5'-nucleotidase n=1 Tax=Aquabacterium sp. TaxID=1872578 RepID=UPI002E31751C|nr:bifunctional metallophosphatase/5'-nucleotidase [Aquabacterium sp.]HEX5354715.1 bifunctional metallophosphatase/5'-nucleotidase [Aquabacterium sp.]
MIIRTLCASLALAFAGLASAQTAPKPPFVVKLIGFNDYHGNLETPGTFGVNTLVPAANRPPVGGAEYMAAYVARMKASNPLNAVVGAGDFIGATPLISALFFDEPAVETLNKIGVEFNAVGNHEFDKGKDELRRLQNGGCKFTNNVQEPNSCKGFGSAVPGTFDGARFKWLSANVVETATGKTLLPAYGIKTFNGVKVAFIGMTLKGTPGIVTPTGVAGLTFQDEADTVNALVPRLRAQGIESIVVLVHQGGFQNQMTGVSNQAITSDINGCTGDLKNTDGSDSDIRAIVKRLDNAVDLVISGHTHAAYNCSANTVDVRGTSLSNAVTTARPTGMPNKVGRLVPVSSASAFGRVLTDIDVTINPATRDIVAVSPRNVLVDRTDAGIVNAIAANPEVKDVVGAYKAAVSPLANAVVATITAGMSNSANAAGEMEAGDLIADAQLAATQPASLGGAQIAFMNAGGVRNPGFVSTGTYPYALTYGDAFTVQPFGNSLVTMTLTAQQIKNVLEQQFSGCNGQTAQRIMQISNGFKYSWSATGTCGSRITEVSFTPTDVTVAPPAVTGPTEMLVVGGVVQNPTKTYRVTVNNFMATGGDGFATLVGGTNQLGGAQDIDALIAYLATYKSQNMVYNPADVVLSKPRISRLP